MIATSYDIGVAHHGGYAEFARVPADWVVQAAGRADRSTMRWRSARPASPPALGVVRMEENGLTPANGPVIVTGATGGVGSLAIDILARLGYQVVALTGKEAETDYLQAASAPGK